MAARAHLHGTEIIFIDQNIQKEKAMAKTIGNDIWLLANEGNHCKVRRMLKIGILLGWGNSDPEQKVKDELLESKRPRLKII